MSRGEASVQSKRTSRESGMRDGGGRGAKRGNEGRQRRTKRIRRKSEGRGTTCQTKNEERRAKNEESKMHRHQVRSPTHAKCERKVHLWALPDLE